MESLPDHDVPARGYYRDADDFLYITGAGDQYLVQQGAGPEPCWQAVPLPMSDDAEPTTLDAEDRELFERVRIAYGIPA
jgi:hypothetical protein